MRETGVATAEAASAPPAFLSGGGKVGAQIRAHDWAATPLGPPERWPQSLRVALAIALHSNLPTSIYWGPDMRLLYNDAWTTMSPERHPWALGRPGKEVWADIWHIIGPQFARMIETGEGFSARDQMLPMQRDGSPGESYWNYNGTPIRDDDGAIVGFMNQGHETTAQVLAERRGAFMLRLSDRLRDLAEPSDVKQAAAALLGEQLAASRVGYAEVDPAAGTATVVRTWTAPGAIEISGPFAITDFGRLLAAELAAGSTVRIVDAASDPLTEGDRAAAAFAAIGVVGTVDVPLIKSGRLAAILFVHTDARRAWRDDEVALIEDVAERTWAAVERSKAEKQLRAFNETLERRIADALAERNLLADLVEGTDALVLVMGLDGRWLAINKAAADEVERVLGMRPKVGAAMLDLLPDLPEQQAAAMALWQRALDGEEYTVVAEYGRGRPDSRFYEIKFNALRDGDGRQIGAYQFAYNVTDRVREQERLRETEEALRQSQKMEAMGQLTGGVAHDFNNLLTPIVGVLDMLQQGDIGGPREQRLIGGAAQSAERARTLVHRLLAFARRQPLKPTAVDVGAVVRGMAELVASTTGPQIRVAVDVAADLPPAKADPNQLEMALLNLSVNARDAMPDGGRLRISVGAETVDAAHPAALTAGRYIRLSVADTGIGMDEVVLARAIEPFFSTKGVGQGTGLGLSMVHGLASQLGGALTISSRPGLGTNIELWLPESDEQLQPASVPADAALGATRGTALLVDDEEFVRLTTADMLAGLGFTVVEAASAEEGLKIVHGATPLALVVTDHLMPGKTGSDMAREIRGLRPGLPILVISGYAESEGIEPDLPRLTKPFRRDELAASLARLGEATA